MKKWMTLLLVLTMLLCLCACDNTPDTEEPTVASTTQSQPDPTEPTDPVEPPAAGNPVGVYRCTGLSTESPDNYHEMDYGQLCIYEDHKVEYTKGEKLDLKGLKVRVIKADGTHFESLNGDKLTIFDGPLDNVGERKIKVSYGEAFTFFYVTVNEGTTDSTESTTPTEPTTEPTTPTEPVDSTEPSEEGTTTPTKPPTEPPTEPSKGDEAVNPTTNKADEKDAQRKTGMPWWGILLIAIAAAGAGVAITILVLKKKK